VHAREPTRENGESMRYLSGGIRPKLAAGAVIAGLAGAALGVLPALADGGSTTDPDTQPRPGRVAEDGSVFPEPEGKASPKTVENIADLVSIEQEIDPEGSRNTFICANPGDTSVVVVERHPANAGIKPDPNAGPINPAADPCVGKSLVTGK
jgi:hypothetical protein